MITRRGIFLWILSILFIAGTVVLTLSFVSNGSEWAMKRYNKHMYSNGVLIGAGTIYDCNGEPLAQTKDGKRVYSDNQTTRLSTLHTVGDPKNFISTSVQTTFDSRLTGYNLMFGVYNIKRYGKGNDMTLTIDSDVCNAAYNALAGRKGTVGVVNYKTGDIVCAVSTPSFDVNNVPFDLETNSNYEGAYINRLLSAHYVPGSTFKLVTAICAIENIPDVYSRTWSCGGEFQPKKGVAIKCMSNHGGHVTFEEALEQSCNSVFAQLAIELGSEKLNETAQRLGFGSSVVISGEIESYEGKLNMNKLPDDKLGWTGIGQGDTRIAPISMLRLVSAIANDGKAVSFNLVNSFANQAGRRLGITLPTNQSELMSSEVAAKMNKLMRGAVKNEYGDWRFNGLTVCAKSGTAQIDEVAAHDLAWFTGYCTDEDMPYAFVVVVENGGLGTTAASPVANAVLQELKGKN
jgi:peptidoglycan glycosyltransferase